MGRVHKKKLAEYSEATNSENKKKNIDEKNGSTDTESIEQKDGDSTDDEYQSTQGDNASVKSSNSKRGKKRRSSELSEQQTETINTDADKSENGAEESLNGNNGKKVKNSKSNNKTSSSSRTKKSHKKKNEDKQERENSENINNDNDDDDNDNDDEDDDDEEDDTNDEPQQEYEVQDVVDYKVERGIAYYLIRWKGYTKNDDTWEPESTLSCPELIEKFKKKQNKQQSKKVASSEKKKSRTVVKKVDNDKIDPEQEWEVDKIINYSEDKGKRMFQIRWKGFSSRYDTWEPEANLSCDEIIDKFMKRIKSQENITFKELREEPKRTKRLVNETALRTNYHNPIGRKSKRAVGKQRVYYGDSDA